MDFFPTTNKAGWNAAYTLLNIYLEVLKKQNQNSFLLTPYTCSPHCQISTLLYVFFNRSDFFPSLGTRNSQSMAAFDPWAVFLKNLHNSKLIIPLSEDRVWGRHPQNT